jgi:hypothetical protein
VAIDDFCAVLMARLATFQPRNIVNLHKYDQGGYDQLALGRRSSKARAMLLAVGASAAVHFVTLMIVLLTIETRQPDREPPTIFVHLIPWRTSPERTKQIRSRSVAQRRATPALNPSSVSPTTVPAAGAAANTSVDQGVAAQESLRKALSESVRCAHPDEFEMDSTERERCRQFAHNLAKGAPTYAALPADPNKAATLERDERLNEAWRSYHKSRRLDDYPGLLSVFGGAEPCPPGPVCWHHLP